MRIFVTSTSRELDTHRTAACDVIREMGHEAVLRDPDAATLADGVRPAADADAVLALVGWRRGPTPGPEDGNGALRPWAAFEIDAALANDRPVAVLLAAETWRDELREDDPAAYAAMLDFRGSLGRLAVPFKVEDGDLEPFRYQVRAQLESALGPGKAAPDVRLRRWPPPEWPARPYPVLGCYTHPALLAGRDREIDELRRQLRRPTPIVGLYAPSGSGKSSLLLGGLVPALRDEGRPVAFERHPAETGLAGRLLADLLEQADEPGDDVRAFVDRLAAVHRAVGRPPVLVLDQFEELFRARERSARTVVARLLAASVQRLPDLAAAPCRWVLAYRQELHGEVVRWLADVLADARTDGTDVDLPHDLSGPDRFRPWPLPCFAADAAGAADVFREAIEKPLRLTDGAVPRYPWHFEDSGAERLAQAFADARRRRPDAPLVPELQVVLAHLLDGAGAPDDAGVATVAVPEDPGPLIEQALEKHLKKALELAFPARDDEARRRRARALLALRELADARGRRDAGLSVDVLAPAIGPQGQAVLERLATEATRIVVREERADGWGYVLSHDRMAEVVVRLVDEEEAYADLGVERELLRLRRLVVPQSQLFAAGEVEQATVLNRRDYRGIEAHVEALLWEDDQRRWWAACGERFRRDRKRGRIFLGIAAVLVALLAWLTWIGASRHFDERRHLARILLPDPGTAFEALAELTAEGVEDERILAWLGQRIEPFDVLERGLGGVSEDELGPAVLRVVELVEPWMMEEPEDPGRVALVMWALDLVVARRPSLADKARVLRQDVLARLWQRRPPPESSTADDPDWVDVPAGTFLMGSPDGEGAYADQPQHQVTLSAFRVLRHEVTNAEYRRLVLDYAPREPGDLPATVSWYEAYTYAAWLGGRLLTEAEWEYAARAGCPHSFCRQDGSEGDGREVACVGEDFDGSRQPVMNLEPNPWGLFDMLGNVSEWTADLYVRYSEAAVSDPWVDASGGGRVIRGNCFFDYAMWAEVASRDAVSPDYGYVGFRVVLPGRPERLTVDH